jgi:DNA-binding transcriptional MerR regulator
MGKAMYTVKELATLAGISPRTLHYYDQIGILAPTSRDENGYRYYGSDAVLKLQQIRFFKELDFSLEEIRTIIRGPDFNVLQALQVHKSALQQKVKRLDSLIQTIDHTILHLKGHLDMQQKELFDGFDEEKQKQYVEEIRQRYGERAFENTIDWNNYTPEEKKNIKAEGEAIYRDLAANMDKGYDSPEVQTIISRWHQHLRYFYEPTIERLLGLAELYTEHPDFIATFQKIHPDLPEFLKQAILYYCRHKTIVK